MCKPTDHHNTVEEGNDAVCHLWASCSTINCRRRGVLWPGGQLSWQIGAHPVTCKQHNGTNVRNQGQEWGGRLERARQFIGNRRIASTFIVARHSTSKMKVQKRWKVRCITFPKKPTAKYGSSISRLFTLFQENTFDIIRTTPYSRLYFFLFWIFTKASLTTPREY